MLANSTYLVVAVSLVVLAVVSTILILALPSQRRARQERKRIERELAAQRRQHRAELRMAPVLWEEERRRAEAERRRAEAERRLVEYAEEQMGSEPIR